METIFQTIGKALVTVAIVVAGIFGLNGQTSINDNVGATVPITVAVFQTSLQTSITDTATSMTLVTGTDKAGNNLSGYICFNIDEGTSLEEFVCGTVSGTAVTNMIRGIDPIDGDLEVSALKKIHRRGASVKVTNYPSLAIISRILNGNETIPSAITYANGIGPSASGDLADKEYVLSVVSGGAVSFEKVVVSGNAGETVAVGNLLYLDSADSEWKKTDADTAASVENVILGIAQGSGTDGNAITGGILIRGVDSNQTGLSANTTYYASNTGGGISSSAGTKEVTIGIATGTTSILFYPRYNQMLTEDQQDALAGNSGTPSSSNRFLTEDYIDNYELYEFGGTGADGALAITSGTTTIDLNSAKVVVKNYTSISITGTGTLAFSNPAAGGTMIVLRSQGDVTLTSSSAPMIDASGMGAVAGTAVSCSGSAANTPGTAGTDGNIALYVTDEGSGGADGGTSGATAIIIGGTSYNFDTSIAVADVLSRYIDVFTGAGGGSGGANCANNAAAEATSGVGGRGGGALIIEAGGAWNFTTSAGISVAGKAGSIGTVSAQYGCASGGGGGGGGYFRAFYKTLTANSGTVTVSGGSGAQNVASAADAPNDATTTGGGAGGGGKAAGTNASDATTCADSDGAAGGAGSSLVAQSLLAQ